MKCSHFFASLFLPLILSFACCPFLLSAQNKTPDTLAIYFSFNNYSVSKSESVKLYSFLGSHVFTKAGVTAIIVNGYTDTAGTEKYNALLSLKRCRSVQDAMQQMASRGKNYKAQLVPLGEQGAAGRPDSLNRRVEVIFYTRNNNVVQQDTVKQHEKPAEKVTAGHGSVIDTIIVLDNLYFEPDRPILTPASMSALPHYISLLKKYINNDMEVGGHVNHTDSRLKETDPLFKLSVQRAETVYGYLIDAGFDPARLTHKGYGNSRLLFAMPENDEERRKNMRVEITIFKSP